METTAKEITESLTLERHRQLAKTLKRLMILASSEIGDIRDKHLNLEGSRRVHYESRKRDRGLSPRD